MIENTVILSEQEKSLILKIPLFRDSPDKIKQTFFDTLELSSMELNKGDIIIRQGQLCRHLNILMKGKLEVYMIDASGNPIKIENLFAPRIFATPHLFDEYGLYPATFTVVEEGKLIRATKESVFKIISSEPTLLKNFLRITGNCTACTVHRLKVLSYKTIRSRFLGYLMMHKTDCNKAVMQHNQTQLAEYLGVTRPALATEIGKMAREGLIQIDDREVIMLNPSALNKYL
ncbi:MAG: Crp/Fnr family transcriptional regulator [Tannerella sp.]|jgi:CRP-like cAMP-binding protein|nr:Crp/Fnr family transcriptional regulator [Tannerella sp.]